MSSRSSHVVRSRARRRSTAASLVVMLAAVSGCPDPAVEDNVLPTGSNDTSSTSLTATDSADASSDATGGAQTFPAAYRFECVDIQVLGDADGTALQAQVLENTWRADIQNYKLNIVFEVVSRDDAAGTGTVGIRSGIGTNAGDLCSEPTSESAVYDITYDAAVTAYAPIETDGQCSEMAGAGASSGGTYELVLGATDVVYIYAQDDDGTTFNCTADDALPDAVPVRAVQATLTVASDGDSVSGTLLGCLREDEASALCSCLGQCTPGQMHEDCAGCPDGSIPLRSLLGNIMPSARCTDLVGANAFDIGLGFNASALPSVPTTCG